MISSSMSVLVVIGATLAFAKAYGGDIGELRQMAGSNTERIGRLEVDTKMDHAKLEGINQKLDIIIKMLEKQKP